MTTSLPLHILDEYYQTHFVKEGRWGNNLTDKPCDENVCDVCKRMIENGLIPMDPKFYDNYF